MKDLQNIYHKQNFSLDNLKKYEFLCIRSLNYNLRLFTASHFILFFANCGYIFNNDNFNNLEILKNSAKKKSHSTTTSLSLKINEENNTFSTNNSMFQSNDLDKIYKLTEEILFNVIDGNIY